MSVLSKERLTENVRNFDNSASAKESLINEDGFLNEYASKVLTKLAEYEDLEERLGKILGEEMSLEECVNSLERVLTEPDSKHPMNARILTYAESAKWDEYCKLEEQGLLLRLPVAVGGAIWVLDRDGKPREMILDEPDIRCHCAKEDNLCMSLCDRKNTGVCAYRFKNDGSDIGETVFLTLSEAEEKLRELEGK